MYARVAVFFPDLNPSISTLCAFFAGMSTKLLPKAHLRGIG